MNKIHGSNNKIHVLRAKIRVLFVFKSLKDDTPLVFSILGRQQRDVPPLRAAAHHLRRERHEACGADEWRDGPGCVERRPIVHAAPAARPMS